MTYEQFLKSLNKQIKKNGHKVIASIDAYLAKEEAKLADTLDGCGFVDAEDTAAEISAFEERVARRLKVFTNKVIEGLKQSDDLLYFSEFVWQDLKEGDDSEEKLAEIFYDEFISNVKGLTVDYLAQTDPELAEQCIAKSIGPEKVQLEISQRTSDWAKNWSEELARLMNLTTHKEIEGLLSGSLERGDSVAEFTQALRDSGIREEYHRAHRVAVTEMLTAHSVAQQESFLQSPAVSEKMWMHTGGYKNEPRPNHVDMNGQRVPVDEPFELAGADGGIYHPMYPRDESLPAGERINCHCAMQPVVSEDILGMSLEERQELQRQAIEEDDRAWEAELNEQNKARAGITSDNPDATLADRDRRKDEAQGLFESQTVEVEAEAMTPPFAEIEIGGQNDFSSGLSSGKIGDTDEYTTITDIRPVDFNDSNAVQREIDSFVERFRNAELEHSIVISPRNEVYELDGIEGIVHTHIVGKEALKGSIIMHNHPVSSGYDRGDSFSVRDLVFSSDYETGRQLLISGERYDSFVYTGKLKAKALQKAYEDAISVVRHAAWDGEYMIEWLQADTMRELSNAIEGLVFDEDIR